MTIQKKTLEEWRNNGWIIIHKDGSITVLSELGDDITLALSLHEHFVKKDLEGKVEEKFEKTRNEWSNKTKINAIDFILLKEKVLALFKEANKSC